MTLSIDKYLRLCGEIEKTIAQIYSLLSGAAGIDEKVSKIWIQMKLEEDDHFAQIELLRRLLRSSGACEKALEDNQVEVMLVRAKEYLKIISSHSVGLQEALEMAIRLEEDFKDFHAGQACRFEDPGLERMFANLSSQDRTHSQRLRQLYQQLFMGLETSL